MAQEYLDIYDEKMIKIGVETREEAHKKGHWHKTFHCWIISKEDRKRYLLFQKRSHHKKICPDLYDITVAGHLLTGEIVEDGIREVHEELGISIDYEDLICLGVRSSSSEIGEYTENEFSYVFMYECNIPLMDYKLQSEEVAGIIRLELTEGMKLFSGEVECIIVSGLQINDKGEKTQVSLEITQKDFIQCLDNYYLKMLINAERYFEGKENLSEYYLL
jgi:isopentenyldiphosphate isomerase